VEGELMSDGPRPLGQSISLPGSPLAEFEARINDELAAGEIAPTCPHPVTVARLYLPARILCCLDCDDTMQDTLQEAESNPPACAICAGRATRWACWLAGQVLAMARLCDPCGTAGNVPMSPN
jgi:hypothetical protein